YSQAEDGIHGFHVTGVQTCALPTSPTVTWEVSRDGGTTWEPITADPAATPAADGLTLSVVGTSANDGYQYRATATNSAGDATSQDPKSVVPPKRSEERRVGKECRTRWVGER